MIIVLYLVRVKIRWNVVWYGSDFFVVVVVLCDWLRSWVCEFNVLKWWLCRWRVLVVVLMSFKIRLLIIVWSEVWLLNVNCGFWRFVVFCLLFKRFLIVCDCVLLCCVRCFLSISRWSVNCLRVICDWLFWLLKSIVIVVWVFWIWFRRVMWVWCELLINLSIDEVLNFVFMLFGGFDK